MQCLCVNVRLQSSLLGVRSMPYPLTITWFLLENFVFEFCYFDLCHRITLSLKVVFHLIIREN